MKCEYCNGDYKGIVSHQCQCKKKRESDDKALVASTTKKVEKKFACEIESINRELNLVQEQMWSLERWKESKEADEYIEMIYPKVCDKCDNYL